MHDAGMLGTENLNGMTALDRLLLALHPARPAHGARSRSGVVRKRNTVGSETE